MQWKSYKGIYKHIIKTFIMYLFKNVKTVLIRSLLDALMMTIIPLYCFHGQNTNFKFDSAQP